MVSRADNLLRLDTNHHQIQSNSLLTGLPLEPKPMSIDLTD